MQNVHSLFFPLEDLTPQLLQSILQHIGIPLFPCILIFSGACHQQDPRTILQQQPSPVQLPFDIVALCRNLFQQQISPETVTDILFTVGPQFPVFFRFQQFLFPSYFANQFVQLLLQFLRYERFCQISCCLITHCVNCKFKAFMTGQEQKFTGNMVFPCPLDQIQSTSHRHLDIAHNDINAFLRQNLFRPCNLICITYLSDFQLFPIQRSSDRIYCIDIIIYDQYLHRLSPHIIGFSGKQIVIFVPPEILSNFSRSGIPYIISIVLATL